MTYKKAHVFLVTLLIISLTIPLSLPLVKSAPVHHKATFAYIGATPNPLGVGQETLIHIGITDELELVQYGWQGLTITVTRPDNTTTTLGPFKTDATGGTGTVFIPDQIGTYYLQTNFPAQWFNWTSSGGADIFYEASTSEKLALNVTESQPTQFYQGIPLPTDYWTRPINNQFRDWYTIAGNWLQPTRNEGPFVPFEQNAPDTAHILWAKPLTVGGLVGGAYETEGYEHGDAYEGLWGNGSPVIMGGIVYYNNDKDLGSNRTERTVSAVDQRTGEELWTRSLIDPATGVTLSLTCGQILTWNSYNYQGAKSYLWANSGSTWNAFDPYTGRWEYSISNVPSGTQIRGPNGEFLIYTYNRNGYLTLWNSTRVVSTDGSFLYSTGLGTTFRATPDQPRNGGYQFNVTVPAGLPGTTVAAYSDEIVLGNDLQSRTATSNILGLTGSPWNFWAINVKSGQEGTLMYNRAWNPPAGNLSLTFEKSSLADNVFTVWSKELRGRIGFNMKTGEQIWGPTEPEYYMQTFGLQSNMAYGKLYSTGYGGHLYAYDLKTGNRLWDIKIDEGYGGTEVLWSSNWPMALMFIADGKIYMAHSEHSAIQPLPRDAPFMAVNATDGNVIFRINGAFKQPRWAGQAGIADGIITLFNPYDNQIYSIGKGPSKTAVTASPKVMSLGNAILIEGTVLDNAAGTNNVNIATRFPNGVAAVSDASMNEYMKHVYMQFPAPTDTTGVQVTLSILDSNNNYKVIGTTTTDANGKFSYMWEPEIAGTTTIYATFSGTGGYYGSTAETAVGVTDQNQTPAPTTAQQLMIEAYFVPAVAAIIVAILLVGLALAIFLKKRV
ncbi:MAG: PQQ-binding-like beta-propeller repeat protein [Nitrososphaerota archaeon]|jgi:hypothetical protein|nr:PQQ-binding-like beta-propeller repeat protein [Nitrososphaerota archaeon]